MAATAAASRSSSSSEDTAPWLLASLSLLSTAVLPPDRGALGPAHSTLQLTLQNLGSMCDCLHHVNAAEEADACRQKIAEDRAGPCIEMAADAHHQKSIFRFSTCSGLVPCALSTSELRETPEVPSARFRCGLLPQTAAKETFENLEESAHFRRLICARRQRCPAPGSGVSLPPQTAA